MSEFDEEGRERKGWSESLNPYVQRLSEFPDKAFAHNQLFEHAGEWRTFLHKSMGKQPQRLVLEIGCSNGAFLNEIAQEHSLAGFCGMDWKFKLVHKACTKSKSLKTENTLFMRARAQDLGRIFGKGELDEVWIFFPDPWPKAAQQKHRLIQAPFLQTLAQCLKPGGKLYFKTDHPGYFEWVNSILGIETPVSDKSFDDQGEGAHQGNRARQMLHRTYTNKDLPPLSEETRALFDVEAVSWNYWADLPAKPAMQDALFAGKKTLFEALFLKDKLPIYYLQLRKR